MKDTASLANSARALLLGAAAATVLSGCSSGGMTRSDWGKCMGAVILGTGAGALVGGEKGAYVGAAAGVAACFVINAQSRQTRAASEVEADYRARHDQLPVEPEVVRYDTQLSAPNVRRGEPLRIVSNIETVAGRDVAIHQVKEQIRIFEPGQGQPFKTG